MPAGSSSSPPRITVVIAVRNGAPTLQRALDSVFEQTYDNLELIVIDGGSTDGTTAIVERNATRIAYWESAPDRGVYHAWNKALDHVSGDWICFLGADDRYHAPDVMAAVASALTEDAGVHRVAIGELDKYYPDGRVRHEGRRWTGKRRKRFKRGDMVPHQATFHHISVFDQHGRFNEWFRVVGDYEFLLRELPRRPPLDIPVTVTDMAGGGLSGRASNKGRIVREIYTARYVNGLVRTPPWRSPRLLWRLSRIWADQHLRWHPGTVRVARRGP